MTEAGLRELREFVLSKTMGRPGETYEVLTEVLAKIDTIREREERQG